MRSTGWHCHQGTSESQPLPETARHTLKHQNHQSILENAVPQVKMGGLGPALQDFAAPRLRLMLPPQFPQNQRQSKLRPADYMSAFQRILPVSEDVTGQAMSPRRSTSPQQTKVMLASGVSLSTSQPCSIRIPSKSKTAHSDVYSKSSGLHRET